MPRSGRSGMLGPGASTARAAATFRDKDRRRLYDTVTRLHAVNSRSWDTEDRVRGALLSSAQVAYCKREIDQFNAERILRAAAAAQAN
ncbi:DUF4254 domain-containing protein [Streptomyces lydicus]